MHHTLTQGSHSEWGQRTPQHGYSYHRPSLAEGSTAHARWVNDRTTTRSRTGGPIPAPSLYCVLRTFTHTPHHTGWHTRRRFGLLSEAYWFVRALGPISGCRGSHGGSGGGRSERYPRAGRNLAPAPSRGRGAAADRGVTAPLRIRTGSSEPCSSLSLDYQKTTVKQPATVGARMLSAARTVTGMNRRIGCVNR